MKKDQKNPVEKSPVEKGRFRLAESDCVRNGLIIILLVTAAVLSLHDRLLQPTADPGMYYVQV